MKTYLGIGPLRSGTTSFYEMSLENNLFNCGKVKEPVKWVQTPIKTTWWETNTWDIHLKNYIKNWDIDSEKNILLDGSGQLIFANNLIEFKKYLDNYINIFKYICLIRNPILYLTSITYKNFLLKYNYDNSNVETSVFLNKAISLLKENNEIKNTVERVFYSTVLKKVKTIYKKEEIFILQIDQFDLYKERLSKFLDINISHIEFLIRNKSPIKYSNRKYYLLKLFIESFIKNDSEIMSYIINGLKSIDNEYETNLYNFYKEKLNDPPEIESEKSELLIKEDKDSK